MSKLKLEEEELDAALNEAEVEQDKQTKVRDYVAKLQQELDELKEPSEKAYYQTVGIAIKGSGSINETPIYLVKEQLEDESDVVNPEDVVAKIKTAVNLFHNTKKGRKPENKIETYAQAFNNLPSRFFREAEIKVVSNEPILIIEVNPEFSNDSE